MAKNKFDLDFGGFLDYARVIDERLGTKALQEAATEALKKSADVANVNMARAMDESPYSFKSGQNYSHGRAKKSLAKVAQKGVEVDGTVITAYAGVDFTEAPEAMILASGTPHLKADTNLKNAIKCKGKYRKQIADIQQRVFFDKVQGAAKAGETLGDMLGE